MMTEIKTRNWCFTLNNYSAKDIERLKKWERVKFMVFGEEIAPTTGTPHLQGYVEWECVKGLKTLKNSEKAMHWEISKGNREVNVKYCSKGANIYTYGQVEKQQGKRNDLIRIKEMVKKGKNAREIYDEAPSFQAMKMAEIGLKLHERKRNWKPIVRWYWGPTGTGKSKTAFEEAKDPWVSGKDLKWWEGYDGHEDVIFDDFRGDFCTFHELLRILDRYEYRVENKGGSRQLLAKNIWITSCSTPDKLYKSNSENVDQLLRRIDIIKHMEQKLERGTEVSGNTEHSLENETEDNIVDLDV